MEWINLPNVYLLHIFGSLGSFWIHYNDPFSSSGGSISGIGTRDSQWQCPTCLPWVSDNGQKYKSVMNDVWFESHQ
jgi:hypothetical protein